MMFSDSRDGALRWGAVSVGARTRAAVGDRLALIDHPRAGFALIVADGAGGIPGGARAAERSVGRARGFTESFVGPFDAPAWSGFLGDLDLSLADDPQCGEAAVLALSVTPTKVIGARVGDVGAWCVSNGRATSLVYGSRGGDRAGSRLAVPEVIDEPWSGTLVVATDGWWRATDVPRALAEIEALALEDACERLVARVTGPSGERGDDVTVVLVRRSAG